MAQINVRIDDDLKTRAEALFSDLGLTMSTAFTLFVRQSVRQGGIPFEITTKTDPFWSAENQRILKAAIEDANAGKLTIHDLIEE